MSWNNPPGFMGDKHKVVNFTKVAKYKLVEFRFGGMTTNLEELLAFGTLAECMVAAGRRPKYSETGERKKKFYEEVIEPFVDDKRVRDAWGVLNERLKKADLGRF